MLGRETVLFNVSYGETIPPGDCIPADVPVAGVDRGGT